MTTERKLAASRLRPPGVTTTLISLIRTQCQRTALRVSRQRRTGTVPIVDTPWPSRSHAWHSRDPQNANPFLGFWYFWAWGICPQHTPSWLLSP